MSVCKAERGGEIERVRGRKDELTERGGEIERVRGGKDELTERGGGGGDRESERGEG